MRQRRVPRRIRIPPRFLETPRRLFLFFLFSSPSPSRAAPNSQPLRSPNSFFGLFRASSGTPPRRRPRARASTGSRRGRARPTESPCAPREARRADRGPPRPASRRTTSRSRRRSWGARRSTNPARAGSRTFAPANAGSACVATKTSNRRRRRTRCRSRRRLSPCASRAPPQRAPRPERRCRLSPRRAAGKRRRRRRFRRPAPRRAPRPGACTSPPSTVRGPPR
mmetsp:Transcript_13134/g.55955  ORF Transcript_13134/g.55955 Transcript_13134/m.55955 type:complete len:224 (-) Transcript_13134:1351-2022(-)